MRPDRLNPLFAGAEGLKGVGPGLARPLEKLGLSRVKDIAYHLPDRFAYRRAVAGLEEASVGEQVVVALTPLEYRSSGSSRAPFRVMASDEAGTICALTWFGRNAGWAKKTLPLGEKRWVAGKLDQFGTLLQMVHPDHVMEDGALALGQLTEAVYPLSDGLTQGRLAALVAQALAALPELPEWIDPGLMAKMGWPAWREAMQSAHRAEHEAARDRLAYDELLANSLALMLVRETGRSRRGTPLAGDGRLRSKLALPFALTGAQRRSIDEIAGDVAQEAPMLRLLQGDVGSGKTVVALDRIEDVIGAVGRHIAGGAQAYWVCPMVRESETDDIAAAEARHAELVARFGEEVVLVHGQLRPEAKDAAMERFARGEAKLLVATTVIEVGVDVPNATLMVIEQAERFGLAQLHQLRGRVGRGAEKSTCLLLRGEILSEVARERLALMRESQDGFRLAEEDLRLRGGGELLGTRQSGDAPFRVASLEQIARLLPLAHDDARLLIEHARQGDAVVLTGERGEAARMLLYLFERDWGVQLLRGG